MFGFGKKKEQTSSSTQQQQSAAPPPPQPTAAATTSDGDMFGGMQTRSRRKKGTEPEPAPEVKAPEPEPPKPEEPKPFFSSFNFANAAGTAVDMSAYQDDPETARVKRRLERFYELYNPSKLSSLDETVKRFAGREAELFEALEKKYGPEPKEPAAATVDKQATNKSGTKPPSRSKASADEGFGVAPASDAGFGTGTADSFGTGSGFGDTTTSGGAGTGFGDGFGGGFGDDQGFGTGADKGGGFGATGFGVTTGFGAGGGFETADGGGFGTVTGGEGFGFGADAATGAGFGFTSEASAFGGGFGDDQGAASSAFGFTTQPEPKTQVEPSSPPDVFGAAIVTPTTAFAPAVNTQQAEDSDSDSSSDGGRYGELERQNEIIESARRQVANARLAGAEALAVEGEKRRLRRSYVESYAKLEGELERLTNAEEYEAADLVNTKLVEVAKAIDQLDSQRSEDLQRVVMRDVVTALETLSSQYSAQRTLLQETKAEEERRTMNYIAESRTKLEQVADVVRGDLDKATRLLKNTEQEVDNLAQRRKKIEDKIAEQTKELRAERDKVSTQATKLEDEIKELEKTLAAKKRMLTERKVALQDMDHQLNLVTDAHRESMSSITSQEAEEATRLAEAQRRVAALTQAREANERATAELQEETEGMMQSLEEHATKIRRFDQNSTVINTTLISNFKEFFTKAIGEVLRARAEPDAVCLNAAPHRADSSGGSQVAALQSKLSSIENEIKATLEAESKAAAQAQELANLLPTLETAKKAAAAAKQFKEAAAKTEEIKRATEDRTAALAKADELRVKAGALEENARQVRKEKKDAAAAYRARIRTFTDRYAQLLRNALVTIDVASSASVAGLQYIDALPLLEASALAAHIHEAHDEADSSDALIDAARKYIMSLFEELSGIIDVPVQTLLVDPDADKQSERLSSRQQSHSPTADHGDAAFAPPADDVQPEGEQTKEGGGADGFGFTATTDEGFGTGFEADGNAGGFGFAAATAADPYAAFTVDELRDQLRDKTAAMEAAAAAEDYMLCDELQSTITALETAIAEREAFA